MDSSSARIGRVKSKVTMMTQTGSRRKLLPTDHRLNRRIHQNLYLPINQYRRQQVPQDRNHNNHSDRAASYRRLPLSNRIRFPGDLELKRSNKIRNLLQRTLSLLLQCCSHRVRHPDPIPSTMQRTMRPIR